MSSLLTKFAVLSGYERHFKPFTDDEAWTLFRLAAFGEAFGWTLLIIGILLKRYAMHGNDLPVLIAGQIHGTLFIFYMAAALLTYPSQKWSRWRVIFAVAASVPPYGSLVFERSIAVLKFRKTASEMISVHAYRRVSNGK